MPEITDKTYDQIKALNASYTAVLSNYPTYAFIVRLPPVPSLDSEESDGPTSFISIG